MSTTNIFNKVSRFVINLLFAFSILCLISTIVTKTITGKASIFGYMPVFIMSGSMEPTLQTHSFVMTVPIDADDVHIGDIVTYKLALSDDIDSTTKQLYNYSKGITIIHRVIGITDDGRFIFKGDNNESPDKIPVTAEQIGYKVL